MSLHLSIPSIADEFWTSNIQALATGGSAIITSTSTQMKIRLQGYGKTSRTNLMNTAMKQKQAKTVILGFTASWDEHPDRDEEWKAKELGRIGEERFRREYGCEFLVFDETLIQCN